MKYSFCFFCLADHSHADDLNHQEAQALLLPGDSLQLAPMQYLQKIDKKKASTI